MLARTLGRTLGELSVSMTAQEFGMWAAEYEREPWGDVRADLHAGIVASTVANYAGKMRAKDQAAAKPADYMPFRDAADGKPSAAAESPGDWVKRLKRRA